MQEALNQDMRCQIKNKLYLIEQLTNEMKIGLNDFQGDRFDKLRKNLADISSKGLAPVLDVLADSSFPQSCLCTADEPVKHSGFFCRLICPFFNDPNIYKHSYEIDVNNLSQNAVFPSYAEHFKLAEKLSIVIDLLQDCEICCSKDKKKTANMPVAQKLKEASAAARKVRVEAEKIPVAMVLQEDKKPRSPYYGNDCPANENSKTKPTHDCNVGAQAEKPLTGRDRICDF